MMLQFSTQRINGERWLLCADRPRPSLTFGYNRRVAVL